MAAQSASLLDRWPARVVALLIAIGMGGLLYHMSPDLSLELQTLPERLPMPQAAVPDDPAFEACLARESEAIDKMRDEGLLDEAKAASFIAGAEARCRATTSN